MFRPSSRIGIALLVLTLLLISVLFLRTGHTVDTNDDMSAAKPDRHSTARESRAEKPGMGKEAAGRLPEPEDRATPPVGADSWASAPALAAQGATLPQPPLEIRRVLSETWVGEKAVGGLTGRQRIRIVETDFKYPVLRLEEDVTLDPKTGEEISEIRRSSVADHLLVGLRENVEPRHVQRVLEGRGFRIRSIEEGSFLLVELQQYKTAEDQAAAAGSLLDLDEFINFAEPDWIVHTTVTPNDPAFTDGKTWSFDNPGTVAGTVWDADIDGPDGWDQRHDASSVVVAVTDTGVRYTHEDLSANMWTDGGGQHGFDAYDDDTDPMDTNGHGTHVAGIIGARGNNGVGTSGVAWSIQLMALRFIGPNGGTTSDAIRVINYARLNGAHIINASWGGGGFSEGLSNAIKACYAADIPVVAAAGNSTRDNDTIPHYPSGYHTPNVVAVASSDANDQLSFFSNYGSTFVDLAAPGADIWSCGIASDSDYRHLSGTSMAAPHVAGALALAKARYPGETFVDLITRLNTSVDTRPAMDRKVATGGRLNLYRLLADSSPSYLHDDFEKPYWFFGCYGYWCYSNARMTREADEDSFSPDTGQKSMWFRWTAPADGLVRFKGEGSSGDISVVAFEGVDRNSLTRMADNFKQRPAKSSFLYFYAKEGRTYTFSVDSRLTTPQIMIGELVHRPINDMWQDAIDLGSDDRIELRGNNCGATAEPWEYTSPHAGAGNGRSVWWKWTPDFSGDFTLSTQSSSFDTVLAVYTGATPVSFVEVASNDDRNAVDWTSEVAFSAVAGTTYHIVVDSYRGSSYGDIVLNGYVPGSLFILKHPESKLARIGDRVTFEVAAAGQGLRYQWELDGQPIPGAVQPHYTILSIVDEDLGDYRVRISDIADTIVSNVATLAELQISPQIVWQTRSRSVSLGSSLDLRVRATGTAPLLYQWFKDDVPIPGANTDQLTLNNVNAAAAANYTVTVSNSTGFTTSDTIDLKVFSSPWEGWSYVDPTTQAGDVFSIVKHGGTWVAAARAPNSIRISTSTDGNNWDHDFIKPDGSVYGLVGMHLVQGNGIWLCAADASGAPNDVVYKSTDLVNWQQYVLPLGAGQSVDGSSRMIFHDGYFYLGVSNFLYRSSDGISWTLQQTPVGANIKSEILVSDGGTRLLACKWSWKKIYVLDNAAGPWREIDVDAVNSSTVDSAYWNNGRFYVYLGQTRYESADGVSWAPSVTPLPTDGLLRSYWSARQGSTVYANGDYGFFASLDGGLNWSSYQNMMPAGTKIAAADSSQVVFGTNLGGLITTNDPFTATYPSPMFTGGLIGVGYEGGQFIAQYHNNTSVSSDGERWTSYPSQVVNSESAAPPYASVPIHIGDEYWQVGYPSSSLPATPYYRGHLPGAVRLAQVAGLPNGVLTGICEGPQGILSIQIPYLASSGSLAKSLDDGANWSTVTVPGGSVSRYSKISYKGGHYFYQAYFGNTYASSDLVNWTDLGSTTEIAFHAGEYWVFSGTNSRRSADLVNWSPIVSMPSPGIFDVISFNGALVGLRSGVVSYSFDGVNWVPMTLGFTVSDLTASEAILLAAGSQGQLAYTGNLPQTSPSVKIVEPAENASYLAGSVIPVKIEAFSPDQAGTPVVRLFYEGILQGELSTPPYEFDLPVGTVGNRLIHVECQNGSGPVALARKRIIVSSPTSVNQFSGFNGKNSLPGPVVRMKGLLISSSNGAISTSVDGLNWNAATLPASVGIMLYFVEGDDRILAYSSGNKAALTLDGVNWFGVTLPGTPYTRIQYSHGMFWSMTSGGAAMNGMLTSPDGVNWTLRSLSKAPSSLTEVVGDPFGILLGRTNSSALWRSSNGGRSWSALTGFSFVTSLSHNGQRFFINEGNGSSRRAGSSTDGVNWVWSAPDPRYYFIWLVNGTAFARDSQGVVFSLSYDGLTWQPVNGLPVGATIIWGDDGYFYGKGPNPQAGGNALLRSHNGIDWDVRAPWPTTESVILIPAKNGIFASTTGGGLWHLAASSSSWTQLYSTRTTSPDLYDFDKDGSALIAINSGDTLIRSENDGRTWQTIYDPGAAQYSQHNHTTILSLGGVWLSWSPGTRLLRSVDGQLFTDITTAAGSNDFKALAKNGTHFAAILGDGSFKVSSDGLSWSETAPPGSFPDINALKLVPDGSGWRALSVGPGSSFPPLKISSSSDGVTWSQISVTGTFSSGVPVLATTSNGTIAGRSSCRFSADGSTWINTNANSSTLAYQNAFHQVKNGWLERSVDGTTWQQTRFFGTSFTKTKVIDGALYLFGSGAFSKLREDDFAISQVQATTSRYGVGATLIVSFVLTNEGSKPTSAGPFGTQVFLTADGFHGNADDQPLGTAIVNVPDLQPGESAVLQVKAIIPNLIRPGEYRAGIWFNRQGLDKETNASNNFAISLLRPVGIPGFLLSTTSVGNGVIAQDTGQRIFANGSRVSLTATSGKGARFTGWAGDALGTESQVTILMDQDRSVQANFASQVGLQLLIRGVGQVTGAGDQGLFVVGETASLQAVPGARWIFEGWSGAATGTSPSASVLMDAPKTVGASFVLPMQAWKEAHFTSGELSDPAVSGNDVDTDKDGLENWKEYLHGSDPRNPLSNGTLQMKVEGGYLTLIYTRLAGTEGNFAINCKGSRDLGTWDSTVLQQRVLHVADGVETVEARMIETGQPTGFFRFHYQQ